MKMKVILFFIFLCYILLGCSEKKTETEKLFQKASKIYVEKGIDKFAGFVEKNQYFAVKNVDNKGMTPLLEAVESKQRDLILLFVDKGASFYEYDAQNKGILDYTLDLQDEDFLKFICDILPKEYWIKKDENNNTPVIKLICNTANFDIIKSKVDLLDDLNSKDTSGKNLLMYAAQYNTNVQVVKYLLDLYINKNDKNNNEWTATMYAARYNPNPLVLRDLLIRGADTDPNSVGLTLTMLASCNSNPGVLLSLFEWQDYQSDVNNQTKQGKTALMYACENKASPAVVKILLENKADVNLKDFKGKTALMYGLESYSDPDVLYLLVAAGANKEDVDATGKNINEYFTLNKVLQNTELKKVLDLETKREKRESIVDVLSEEKKSVLESDAEVSASIMQKNIDEVGENKDISVENNLIESKDNTDTVQDNVPQNNPLDTSNEQTVQDRDINEE